MAGSIDNLRLCWRNTSGYGQDHDYTCDCRPVDVRAALDEIARLKAEVEQLKRRELSMSRSISTELQQRIIATGDESPAQWNFVADVIDILVKEASRWTNRADDAMRIPDMLAESGRFCRERARKVETDEG